MAPSPGWQRNLLLRLVLLAASCGRLGAAGVPVGFREVDEDRRLSPDLGPANRRARQLLTAQLNDRWALRALPAPSCMFGTGCQAVPSFPRRRLRRLFERQRANWHRRSPRLQRWGGWPLRAQRVGEASHPGPPAPGTPLGGERPYPTGAARRRARPESPHGHDPMQVDGGVAAQGRVYCPVRGCPCGDSRGQAFQGWASVACMRAHIDCHLAGTLQGEVPAEWMQAQRRQRCRVCGLSVSVRHGIHPTCHPAARAAAGDQPDQAGAPGLPTLADIQAGGTRTLRHVPPAARFLWGRVFTRALAEVVEHNNLRAWTELLMLPQCVLGAPARGGRRHRKAIAAYTLDRLQRWLDGERSGLWHDKHELPGPRARSLTPEQKREFAVALAREGFHKKACNALLSSGLCPDNAETANALRALHPAQPAPEVNFDGLPLAAEVVPDVVAKALRQLPADTAPGPCGLRVQHIREAGPPGASLGMLEHLAATVGLLSQGRACPQVAPVLAGASLVALPKPGGGVRPIAVGEILRRLTSKCLMMMVRDDARQYFAPVQLGVGVPSGAEAAVHTVRAWLQRHHATAGHVMVKLDFTNAFNNVDRRAVLEAVAAAFPGLARWTAWCYGQPAQLRFGASTTLQSAGGVQQGDPLGPLLFATALHQLAQELRTGLALTIFYLDDGIIAGDMAAVGAAVAHLQQRGAALGLQLNLSKSEVIAVGDLDPDTLGRHLPAQLLQAPDGSSKVRWNFELLGAAVGTEAFVAEHTAGRVQKAAPLLEALAEVEDAQVALRLLKHCAGHCRLVHGSRCTPPPGQLEALRLFDDMVRNCFSSFTGLHLNGWQWQQAARGLAHAGLGVRSAAADASAAYLASVGGCLDTCRAIDPEYAQAGLAVDPAVVQAAADLGEPVAPHLALGMRQKSLTAAADVASWRTQLAGASATARALLQSEAQPGARAFLAAVPRGAKRMETATFVAEIRQRLLVPDAREDTWCPRCDGVLDSLSLHAGTCVAGGERVLRHNAVRDVLCRWADQAGLQPEKERPGLLLPQQPGDLGALGRRPADVYLPSLFGAPAALDIAITAPQRPETLALAGQEALAAAAAYRQVKMDHLQTAQLCSAQGVRFVPMVLEATGAWETSAAKILLHISRAVATRTQTEPAVAHAELLQELCVAVRVHRARAILRRRAELAAE
ncbi:unnamed protein product [Symbiodinium natans]|uniref:Reverse transcriptase domain-containing protein n=1 Tax=Symbiodinium natans TaxID=878477 RepID=A0A812SIY8_9DINO|nr:unnamed protein product [Symbiodinium natans]